MHPLIVHLIKIMYFLNIVFYYSHLNIILIQICNSINNNNIYNVYYILHFLVYMPNIYIFQKFFFLFLKNFFYIFFLHKEF